MRQARPLKSSSVAAGRPAPDHILALMREQLEAIRAHEPGTRAGIDPEQLHRMRTAVRRLRAILGAAREMFDPEWVGGLRSERSEEHTSELQSQSNLVCRLLLEKKKKKASPAEL